MNYKFNSLASSIILGISYLAIGALITLLLISNNFSSIEIATWIIAVVGAITTSTILIYYRQYKSDHERSRREKAVDLLVEWTKNLNEKSSLAKKFAETLDQKQSLCLFNQETFMTEVKNKKLLDAYFAKKIEAKDNKIHLSMEDVAQLRWDVISYLNLLEAILTAWRHNIADKDMILEEFKYLVKPSEGHDVLKEFRAASCGSFPAITQFVSTLESNQAPDKGKGTIA